MSQELNCKWYFGPQAKGNEKGPNNPTALTFKGTKYHSLIRESIQNSLDAVDDSDQPVTVSFDYRGFSGLEFPEFFKLKDHIIGCLDKYPNDENGEKLFRPMLEYFDNFQVDQNMGYLRIVDTNTTGMHYDPDDAKSPFNAFISEGIASKPNGAGGSFGFGKAVFWMLSPISTVFVSSKTDFETNFEGQSKLCTHFLEPGKDLSPNGLYDTNGEGKVITEELRIPEYFRPKQKGTSVFVLGVPYVDEEIHKELVESVLRNFWMAIYRKKLIVKIEHEVIDSESLPILMESHFELLNNKEKEIFDYNPRFFYDIVVNAENGSDSDYTLITDSVTMNGHDCQFSLYIHKQQDAIGQFVFMRSPLMTVFTEKMSACKGADGVFICDSEYGNNHLREMEDCSHDSWSRKNYEARNNTPSIVATYSLNAIKQYIRDAVRAQLKQDAQETEQVIGLDKILTISIPKATGDKSKKDEIVDPESFLDKKVNKEKSKETNPKPSIRQPRRTKAKFDPQGRLLSNAGGKRKKSNIKGPIKPGTMKNRSTEDENGKSGIYAVPVNVSYRTWSQIGDDGKIWHKIRIFSDKEIDNALVQVYGVDEEGKSMGLNIAEVLDYKLRVGEEFVDSTDFDDSDADSKAISKQVDNAIEGVHINANVPLTISVRFNSDIKYSLRINTDNIVSNENQ
jgi:hypothetical protein